jgi:hypothetical protein
MATFVAAVVAVVLDLATLTGFGLFPVERRKRLRMEGEGPEAKSESSRSSDQEVPEARDESEPNK